MIEKAPGIRDENRFFWNAFQELTSCRQLGMAVGPIPTTAILKLAELFDLDKSETFELLEVVRAVDNGYLKLINDRERKAGK